MNKMSYVVEFGTIRTLPLITLLSFASFPYALPLSAAFLAASIGEEYGEQLQMEYCANHNIPYNRVYNYGD